MALAPTNMTTHQRHRQFIAQMEQNFIVYDQNGNELEASPPMNQLVRASGAANITQIPQIVGNYRVLAIMNPAFRAEMDRTMLRMAVSFLSCMVNPANNL
jgi:hypothetical protein